jgi:hypothetical protein
MKKFILLLVAIIGYFVSSHAQMTVNRSYGAFLGVLDTLTNADATSYTTTISGNKTVITYQVHVLKISGTVAGSIKLYISADGTNWPAAASDSLTLADASGNYQIRRTANSGVKHKITVATTGTSSTSQRTYLFYRD